MATNRPNFRLVIRNTIELIAGWPCDPAARASPSEKHTATGMLHGMMIDVLRFLCCYYCLNVAHRDRKTDGFTCHGLPHRPDSIHCSCCSFVRVGLLLTAYNQAHGKRVGCARVNKSSRRSFIWVGMLSFVNLCIVAMCRQALPLGQRPHRPPGHCMARGWEDSVPRQLEYLLIVIDLSCLVSIR